MKKLFMEDDKIAYFATEDGKIWSRHKTTGRWFELKPGKDHGGYLRFSCWQNCVRKDIRVHRAVWEAFHGKIPEGLEINHKNCVRDDNRLENLELVTRLQNNRHSLTREHRHEAARPQMKPVIDVTTGKVYESTREAARQLGLYHGSIFNCCNGRQHQTGGHTFAYVPDEEERVEQEIHDHIESLANELSGGML